MNTINPIRLTNTSFFSTDRTENSVCTARNVSFGESTGTDVLAIKKKFNSEIAYDYIKTGNYTKACTFLADRKDFNPNYFNLDNAEYLLDAIYTPKGLSGKIRSFLSDNKKALICKIVLHKEFYPTKDYLGLAIKNNDVFLADLLVSRFKRAIDKYGNNFQFYMDKTKDKSMIDILRECQQLPYNTEQKQVQQSENGNLKASRFYEEDFTKKFKVNIPDTVPETLAEVGGLKQAKQDINDFIIRPWSKDIRHKLKENNIEMPNGFLMYGPPGCGKTYIVKVIAKQTGYPMYEVDLSTVGDSEAYSTEKTLKRVFEALESQYQKNNQPCILFLDEIDSIAAARSNSNTDWKRDEINCLLSLVNNISQKGIILIGATNFPDNVDNALLRTGRMDKKIEIGLPDFEERKDILTKLISMKKIALPLLEETDKLAELTDGKNCSDLNVIINIACRQAIYDSKKAVNFSDVENAMHRIEYEKKKRVSIGFHK